MYRSIVAKKSCGVLRTSLFTASPLRSKAGKKISTQTHAGKAVFVSGKAIQKDTPNQCIPCNGHTYFQRSLQEVHCPSGASQFVMLFIAFLQLTSGFLSCKFIYSCSFLKGVNKLAIHRRCRLARLRHSLGCVAASPYGSWFLFRPSMLVSAWINRTSIC